LDDIFVNQDIGNLYKTRHGGSEIWSFTGTRWEQIDNNLDTRMAVAASAGVYKLRNDGSIWFWTGLICTTGTVVTCPGWEEIDNNPEGYRTNRGRWGKL
jgi:hypothetical protein